MIARSLLMAVAFFAVAASAHAEDIDPVARVGDGFIECYGPDTVARACAIIANYRVLEDGQILGDGVVHIQNNPTVLFYATSRLYRRHSMLCERVERAPIDAARVTVDGRPAEADVERQIKELFWSSVAAFTELCTRYVADGAGASVRFYADGVERPELADSVIWVRPEDGYTLGAADSSAT
jgi:hypothetical protein